MRHGGAWIMVALAAVSPVFGATPITHAPLACLSPDINTKITARVEGQPTSVRVYFHAIGQTCGEYYVDMRPSPKDPALYSAIMPFPAKDADVVMYQIRAKAKGGAETAIAPVAATVRKDCVAPALSADDLQAAKAIAIGLTQASQKAAPCKFRCDGVTNYIAANGDMKPNEECRLVLAALQHGAVTKPWYATTAAEATGVAVAAGAAAYEIDHNKNHNPPSPARP